MGNPPSVDSGESSFVLRRLGGGWAGALVVVSTSLTALLLASCADDGGQRTAPAAVEPDRPRAAAVATPSPIAAAQPTLEHVIGQRLIARLVGTRAERRVLQRARAGLIGGVILFGDNITSVTQTRTLVRRLQRAAREGGNPPLWVTVDQEGGDVRRFSSLPPRRSAAQLAAGDRPLIQSREAGRLTALGLRRAAVNVDLAPVADIAHVTGGFLGGRSFGSSAARAAPIACAFAQGLAEGGVIPTLKHFPGLGYAAGTTDEAPVRIDRSARKLRADLEPYRRCADSGLVMVASARYPRLLARDEPAVLAPALYGDVLPATGFDGLTISDDLQTPALAGEPEVAVRAARAGLDLLLYASSPAGSEQAYARLLTAARGSQLSAPALQRTYERIVARKAAMLTSDGMARPALR